MYKIGIVGHSPEHFTDKDVVKRSVDRVIDLLSFQYGDSEVVFNVAGDIGVGLWAANSCRDQEHKYHLFLPFPPETTSEHWYDDQKRDLNLSYSYAYALSVMGTEPSGNEINEHIVDNSNFIIAFWVGKRQGNTFDTIKYAMKKNKLALNGLDDLRLLTNNDVRIGHGRDRE